MKTAVLLFFVLMMITSGLFAQSKSVESCTIWKPESFCNIPDSLITLPRVVLMESANISAAKCGDLDKDSTNTGVWLTLNSKGKTQFNISGNLINITLIRKSNGEVVYPLALIWDMPSSEKNENTFYYMSAGMSASKFLVKFSYQKKIDLVLIFPGAKSGDKVIIEGLVEAVIR